MWNLSVLGYCCGTVFIFRFQPDEYAVSSRGVRCALQHNAVAYAHLHHAPVSQAAPLLPPLDVWAARQNVHHHKDLGGEFFNFSF